MTTIPQQLREIADVVNEAFDFIGTIVEKLPRQPLADELVGCAYWLREIAAELEAPAADSVPVVGYLYEDEHGNQYLHQARNTAWIAPPQSLVRQRDHLATVSALQQRLGNVARAAGEAESQAVATVNRLHAEVAALQARINELESRQVPASARDEYVVVWPDGGRCVGNTLKSAQDYMSGAVPSCAERGVEPPVIVRYVPAETVPYAPHTDTSKEQP